MIEYQKSDIEAIKADLLNSKIIAFPTDTVFGLACLYSDEKAIDKIYEAKNRSIDKKLPIMVSDIEMLEKYVEVSNQSKKLIKTFMPGAITLIFKYKNSNDTVAIRMPNDEWILKLIKSIACPLHVTSANLSGSGSLLNWEDVKSQIGDAVDGIVMANATGKSASTIVNCADNFKILRKGPITEEEIKRVLEGD